MTDYRVLRLKTPADCEIFAQNVEKEHPELAREARRRGVEYRAFEYGAATDAEREALQAVYAFEEVRSQQTGKRARANRTWQSIQRNGIIATVDKVVARNTATDGYASLIQAGMQEFTFEAVVLRYPAQFSDKAIEQAKKRTHERYA